MKINVEIVSSVAKIFLGARYQTLSMHLYLFSVAHKGTPTKCIAETNGSLQMNGLPRSEVVADQSYDI